MSRVTIVAFTVMMASTAALAQIPDGFLGAYQTQNQVGAIANTIDIAHGHHAKNVVSLDIDNYQEVDNVHHLWAEQAQHGFLMQVGKAHADSGTVSILQDLGSAGGQIQMIGSGIDPKYQGQTNALAGAQLLAKMGGEGSGHAFQVGKVRSSQYGENAAGYTSQSSAIHSFQDSNYAGDPGDTGMVTSSVMGVTEQEQFVF